MKRPRRKSNLTLAQILVWADSHHKRTGKWPISATGAVVGSDGENWSAINEAMRRAQRGLPSGWTMGRLLGGRRGVPFGRGARRSPLDHAKILNWADRHFRRTRTWPNKHSGMLLQSPAESWLGIDNALRHGTRGLPGRETLAKLLERERAISPIARRPKLTVAAILRWAEAHFQRTGRWPCSTTGPIPEAPLETWDIVVNSLHTGGRGLPNGLSLRGNWPQRNSGPIPEAPGETWQIVNAALRSGRRGLPGGMTLPRVIAKWNGVK